MGWATSLIEKLKEGKSVTFCPRGNSMSPRIQDGQRVLVSPVTENTEIKRNNVVLCTVNGRQYLHIVKAISSSKTLFLIGNNKGGVNGWTVRKNIHGLLV